MNDDRKSLNAKYAFLLGLFVGSTIGGYIIYLAFLIYSAYLN